MDRDTELAFGQLAAIVADQLKINADLRAEIDALTKTLKESQSGFGLLFEHHLGLAMGSESYRRQVETAVLVRKLAG